MNKTNKELIRLIMLLLFYVASVVYGGMAMAIDWDRVKGKNIILFYPGQSSWEWVLTDHSASKSVKKGTDCLECHEDEEQEMGGLLVSGEKMEPNPQKGKPGSIKLNAKFAHDEKKLYVKLEWEDSEYKTNKKMDPDFFSKVAIMFDDGMVKEASIAGCWGACHDDSEDMPSATKEKEKTLYLTASRTKLTRQGGGENIRSISELEALKAKGVFLEYWQARINPGKTPEIHDGIILDKRHSNKTPAVDVTSELKNGTWTVIMSRLLDAPGDNYKNFTSKKRYNIGFSLHDDYAAERYHYVSFGYSLAIDKGKADFIADKN
ncbi:MAG: cytochrome c-552 precursor [Gammaproteobacteria bacterium]|nr:cytochrome c-552 precursor [Gammaproteobacteria bacterium]